MTGPLHVEVDVLVESPLPDGASAEELVSLVEFVLKSEGQTGDWSIAVVLTSDAAIRVLHRDFMGIDTETDVMTFPADDPRGSTGGDIVISVERAADQAEDWEHTAWQEVRFLVAHGVLHLCGWNDHEPDDRAKMLERQRELIAEFEH